MLHKAYLKLRKPAYYQSLLLSGKLDAVLADVEGQTAERYEVLIEQMSQREGISEKLKEENQMEWVRRIFLSMRYWLTVSIILFLPLIPIYIASY